MGVTLRAKWRYIWLHPEKESGSEKHALRLELPFPYFVCLRLNMHTGLGLITNCVLLCWKLVLESFLAS